MSVRVRLPAPARRKRHIACDELFHFITKLIARSFCCSSLPNRTRCRWAPVWVRRCAAVLSYYEKMSILTAPSTWSQSPLCDHVFLCLWQKRRHPPAPLLLLSKSNPLRWASIWFWAETWRHWHLYCCDVPKIPNANAFGIFTFFFFTIPSSLSPPCSRDFWREEVRGNQE